ncbi:pseudouridine synthase [Pseudobdellovibrio exovorus]|uniref:Pseudouridine synthase Rlu family protein n=1 Tax=Pseudobdellovibrio exovorus JSS TaxID=1184267 RepID=M4V8Q5_9BACT|nr:pseudouridine synthase [Pseudobdellovibrio exovorus]AGH95787.1 pseudouridine synthase Rlu family protein [Pseudobdellovibrio exovorus JSS]
MQTTDLLALEEENTTQPQILFEDEDLLLLFKPSTWFVHPPENPRFRRGLKRRTCVQWLKDVHGIRAFPAHRLDAATEGILIFGKNKEATAHLNLQFKNHETHKVYYSVVRGWLREEDGRIELPLELDSTGELVPCETNYRTLARIEHPVKISKKFDTSRYSLLEVSPKTGRWHQIRRHMNRVSHPIIGDREHGDSHHNRYYRDQLKINGLCLWAKELTLTHPRSGQKVTFQSPTSEKWQDISRLFSYSI